MNARLGLLKKPPLVYTLAVVRFSEIQKIADYIPDIQEKLRRKYPDFLPTAIRGITFELAPNEATKISTNQSFQWSFVDADREWGVLLQSNLLLFHTSRYKHFDAFGTKLSEVLEIVSAAAEITHYNTLGLRYIDVIAAKPGKDLTYYIEESLLPFKLKDMPVSAAQSRCEHQYTNQLGTLFLRCQVLDAGEPLPPDLKETAHYLSVPITPRNEQFAILDTDHTYRVIDNGRVKLLPFNTEDIVGTLNKMHRSASDAFKRAVKKDAIKEWSGG
jgi:uncharacterized protein (TIGR04255 family)